MSTTKNLLNCKQIGAKFLKWNNAATGDVNRILKKHGAKPTIEVKWGRGTMKMYDPDVAARAIEAHLASSRMVKAKRIAAVAAAKKSATSTTATPVVPTKPADVTAGERAIAVRLDRLNDQFEAFTKSHGALVQLLLDALTKPGPSILDVAAAAQAGAKLNGAGQHAN